MIMSFTFKVTTANSMAAAVELVSPWALAAWNNIAHVFDHKQVARLALRDQFRQHPRVGAGNEQTVGILSLAREFTKKLPIIPKFLRCEICEHLR